MKQLRSLMVGVAAWAGVAANVPAQQGDASRATRVLVSAREVRVIFPSDTFRTWGWPAAEPSRFSLAYYWGATIDGIDGPRALELRVGQGQTAARAFPDLRSLVAAGESGLCTGGMMVQCTSLGASASVDRGHVVLTLRDARAITRLFGMRPESVQVSHARPENQSYRPVSVAVEYVRPQIPNPDPAFRAEAARAKRRYLASIHSIRRSISNPESSTLWVGVGDSMPIDVNELRCTHDLCSNAPSSPVGAVWAVDDSALARIRLVPAIIRDGTVFEFPRMYLFALARGRTKVRVSIPPSPVDTMPFQEPPERKLERDVVVSAPAVRVEISPRTDTVAVGEPVELRLTVFDRDGGLLDGAPVYVTHEDGTKRYGGTTTTGSLRLVFEYPGSASIVASFGKLADTLRVTVVGKAKR